MPMILKGEEAEIRVLSWPSTFPQAEARPHLVGDPHVIATPPTGPGLGLGMDYYGDGTSEKKKYATGWIITHTDRKTEAMR